MSMEVVESDRGCLLGLAVEDVVGTTLESRTQGTPSPQVGAWVAAGVCGRLSPRKWADDTSMGLSLFCPPGQAPFCLTSLAYSHIF